MAGVYETALRITAYVRSRLKRSDFQAEMARMDELHPGRAKLEIAVVFGALFACAFIGASFGWIGLGLYFAIVFILFY